VPNRAMEITNGSRISDHGHPPLSFSLAPAFVQLGESLVPAERYAIDSRIGRDLSYVPAPTCTVRPRGTYGR
jgi:hypothetical protein